MCVCVWGAGACHMPAGASPEDLKHELIQPNL